MAFPPVLPHYVPESSEGYLIITLKRREHILLAKFGARQ